MRAIGYVRVSKKEQAESGLGLGDQRRRIEEYALYRGWDLLRTDADEGLTGTEMSRRPALRAALASLAAGEAGALVAVKVDRLARNMGDFVEIIEAARDQHWDLVVIELGMDTSTPIGRLVAFMMAAFAQFEAELIGERTKRALAEARRQGRGRGQNLLPETEALILRLRADGETWSAIARELAAGGHPTSQGGEWAPTTVRVVHGRLAER